jgi:hypothetical protein
MLIFVFYQSRGISGCRLSPHQFLFRPPSIKTAQRLGTGSTWVPVNPAIP